METSFVSPRDTTRVKSYVTLAYRWMLESAALEKLRNHIAIYAYTKPLWGSQQQVLGKSHVDFERCSLLTQIQYVFLNVFFSMYKHGNQRVPPSQWHRTVSPGNSRGPLLRDYEPPDCPLSKAFFGGLSGWNYGIAMHCEDALRFVRPFPGYFVREEMRGWEFLPWPVHPGDLLYKGD